jgi:predicted GTPase
MTPILNTYNICFLGRTGNGKSSLINNLFGASLPTDPLIPCTKILSATTKLSDEVSGFDAITAYDTPGIGEFSSIVPYQRYYEYAVNNSHCIVLVTTLDRNDASAQRLLLFLKDFINKGLHPRFVIALNHIDSRVTVETKEIEVWDEATNAPTEYRQNQIDQRIVMLEQKFADKFLPFEIIPVCAIRKYGLENLKNSILNK